MYIAAENIEPLNNVFYIWRFPVHWYGVIIGIGILVALIWAIREGKKHGLPQELFMDLILFGVPIGIIGGRLYFVLLNWDYYNHNPAEIFAIWKGGLAIHGVLVACILLAIVMTKLKKLPFWKVMDIAAPGILLAQAIGRWGNFMNQEAHGGVVERSDLERWHLPEFIINQMYIGDAYYEPTFLYESLWNVLGVIVLIALRHVNWSKLKLKQGEIFFSYLIWYSCGRFYIEGLRTDSLMLFETIQMARLMSVVLVVGSIVFIIYRRVKINPPDYWVPVETAPQKATTKAANAKQQNQPKPKKKKRRKKK